jgi:hypothetical protein
MENIRDSIVTTTEVQVEVPYEVTVEVPYEVTVEVPYEVTVEVPVTTTVPLECEWGMPTQTGTQELDPEKVNIDFTDQTTDVVTALGRVPSEADCANYENGWYYDDPLNPTRILTCPTVCDQIKATDARIDIRVGCVTRIAVPR